MKLYVFRDSYASTSFYTPDYSIPSNSSKGFTLLTLSCNHFMVQDIELALKKIKPKHTIGPDRIPALFIHYCATALALLLFSSICLCRIVHFPIFSKTQEQYEYTKSNINCTVKIFVQLLSLTTSRKKCK